MLTRCNVLWIGAELGPVERACLRSVLRQGHPLVLWCYEPVQGVPAGIEIGDAAQVLPPERIIRYRSGSYALFSNRFRYQLQYLGLGTWLDCDAYLLRPLESDRPYLIGEYEPGRLNQGILRVPADSPLLPALLALFEEKHVPSWLPWRAWIAARWRLFRTGKSDVSRMPWGMTGPTALTALVKNLGLDVDPCPPEVLYPARWQDAHWVVDPAIDVESIVTDRTVSIHLWNERIKHLKQAPAPPGSFLARLQEEGRE